MPIWTNRYDGFGGDDQATALALDGDGNIFVSGYSWNGSFYDFLTIKYAATGVMLWSNRYDGPINGHDKPLTKYCLAIGPDGAAFITGASQGNFVGASTYDYTQRHK